MERGQSTTSTLRCLRAPLPSGMSTAGSIALQEMTSTAKTSADPTLWEMEMLYYEPLCGDSLRFSRSKLAGSTALPRSVAECARSSQRAAV
ncbi:hypothetical protein RB195_016639 [Necator americanus]|uniref:Uncharacterized protein n=1 Tax=Necator americanus TaxID=51031 RepID=A0ABR1C2Z2_NECAM